MRSDKEIAREALKRAAIIRDQRKKKKRGVYAICYAAACLLVIIGLSFALAGVNVNAVVMGDAYSAALFAGNSTGGFVIIGIIGFALGAAGISLFMHKQG